MTTEHKDNLFFILHIAMRWIASIVIVPILLVFLLVGFLIVIPFAMIVCDNREEFTKSRQDVVGDVSSWISDFGKWLIGK